MKTYELTFLFKSDEDVKKAQKQVGDWIKELKGKVLKKENWGLKDLAYQTNKQTRALYLYFEVKLSEKAPSDLDKKVRLSENILRHLAIAKRKK